MHGIERCAQSRLEFASGARYTPCNILTGKMPDMATTNPLQFIQQVRSEVSKVVWPTRREVFLTTVMVFIMAALTAIFFAFVDILIRWGLEAVLTMLG